MSSKTIVCIKQSFPKSNLHENECLDLIMALASFDYNIQLIFYGDGILSLLDSPNDYSKRLHALPLFDVTDIWVEQNSLTSRKIDSTQIHLSAKTITATFFRDLIDHSLGVYTL